MGSILRGRRLVFILFCVGLADPPAMHGQSLSGAFGDGGGERGREHGEWGRIAFVSNREGNNDIYLMRPDGTDVVNITNHPASDRLPSWSWDGSKIAFQSTRNGNTEVYVMDDDGSNVVRLTDDPAVDTSPSWTADGRVLFSSNRSGR